MKQWHKLLILCVLSLLFAHAILSTTMRLSAGAPRFLAAVSFLPAVGADRDYEACGGDVGVSLAWYPPPKTDINDLDKVMHGSGTHGFIFDSSEGPKNDYNFCNMPRVNPDTYAKPGSQYTLEYAELITRHHKRTPYAANKFLGDQGEWFCDDEKTYYGAEPVGEGMKGSANTYWSVYTTESNPFTPQSHNGTCQFPQVTGQGLLDSFFHGRDSRRVYADLMELVIGEYRPHRTSYRVTNNPLTSQVVSRLITGSWAGQRDKEIAVLVQPSDVDSLEPSYPCPAAQELFASYGPGSNSDGWREHLVRSEPLKKRLDAVTGVDRNDAGWSDSYDHYFDNLAARLCHQKSLPCSKDDPSHCITREDANKVFRLGQYEYSYIYRDSEESLRASVASYGVYLAELVQNMRHHMSDELSATEVVASSRIQWRNNVAHDGSIARILSILQVSQMVWPGMGAELVFELYSQHSHTDRGMKCYFLRVLWGGQVLRSSHPSFRRMDMIPIGTFLAYIDGLVGVRGSKIPAMCSPGGL